MLQNFWNAFGEPLRRSARLWCLFGITCRAGCETLQVIDARVDVMISTADNEAIIKQQQQTQQTQQPASNEAMINSVTEQDNLQSSQQSTFNILTDQIRSSVLLLLLFVANIFRLYVY